MQEKPTTNVFDDGAMTNFGLGKKHIDGYVMLTDNIYGGEIPEEAKLQLLKYKVTYFDEQKEKFTLEYLAKAIEENGFLWIYFPDD